MSVIFLGAVVVVNCGKIEGNSKNSVEDSGVLTKFKILIKENPGNLVIKAFLAAHSHY